MLGVTSTDKLSKIVQTLAADPLTRVGVHRATIEHEVKEEIAQLSVSISLPLEAGGETEWKLLEPNRLLAHVVENSPQLAEAYGRAANEHMPSLERPWDLLICFDEFVPGDKLKTFNSRKTMVLGFNFRQLGEEILSYSMTWMIPITVLANFIHDTLGGWSHMLAQYLRMQLLGTQGLMQAGVTLVINGAPLTIFANVDAILADYDGVRLGWDWKGANSLRPCLRCWNVFKKNSDVAGRLPNCVEITCADKRKLVRRSNEDFINDVDLISEAGAAWAAGRLAKVRFEELKKTSGQNFNPMGFVADRVLRLHFRPLDVLNQDWVHGMLSDGIMTTEMSCFLEADGEATRKDYENFMKGDIRFPKHMATKGSAPPCSKFSTSLSPTPLLHMTLQITSFATAGLHIPQSSV